MGGNFSEEALEGVPHPKPPPPRQGHHCEVLGLHRVSGGRGQRHQAWPTKSHRARRDGPLPTSSFSLTEEGRPPWPDPRHSRSLCPPIKRPEQQDEGHAQPTSRAAPPCHLPVGVGGERRWHVSQEEQSTRLSACRERFIRRTWLARRLASPNSQCGPAGWGLRTGGGAGEVQGCLLMDSTPSPGSRKAGLLVLLRLKLIRRGPPRYGGAVCFTQSLLI